MQVRIEESWSNALKDEFALPYFHNLTAFVRNEYLHKTVYPHPKYLFSAFSLCPLDDVRVVILGQDPYHGARQAHGLCFSVPDGVALPPSLVNIYKELSSDLGVPAPRSGNLSLWARQGVLLLNATLSVEAHRAGSHQNKGWEQFTDRVVALLSERSKHIVFLLWGAYAQKKGAIIDREKHCVLEAPHPSPLSAHRGFFGCRHFSKTNAYLVHCGEEPIRWG